MAERLLIRGGTVLTMDPVLGDLPKGDVLVHGETIEAISPEIDADDCRVIDAEGAIVSPGFVDTHRHVWQTQLRGVAAEWTLYDYVLHMRMVFGSLYTPDDAYLGNLCGTLEALDAGITSIVDHSHIMNSPAHADEALRGLGDSGIRAVFCYGLYPNPRRDGSEHFALDFDPGWRMEDAARLRRERLASDSGRVLFGLAPSESTTVSFAQTEREIALARELGARRISMHVAMGRWDQGDRTVEKLAVAGHLADDLLFVHGATLTDGELRAISESGASISCTPETELQMGMGRPVHARATKEQAATSLGIDIASNFSGDMFAQMRLLLQSERGFENEKLERPPRGLDLRTRDVLELATIAGARAAGLEAVTGSLTPGKQADLIVTRTDSPHMAAVSNPVAALVLYAAASDVDMVLVGGRVLKENGKLSGIQWPKLRDRLRESGSAIRARASEIRDEGLAAGLDAVMYAPPRGRA
jgi:cytosine/adenosine deaminase-related metal-dependent hydrolase